MVRGRGHPCAEGAGQPTTPDGALEARVVDMDPGAAPAEPAVPIEDRGAVLAAGEAEQVSLRGALAAPRAASDRVGQDSSASPVGSADSTAGSRASGSAPSLMSSLTASSSVPASSASSASSNSCSSSSSEPVRTVTSSVS